LEEALEIMATTIAKKRIDLFEPASSASSDTKREEEEEEEKDALIKRTNKFSSASELREFLDRPLTAKMYKVLKVNWHTNSVELACLMTPEEMNKLGDEIRKLQARTLQSRDKGTLLQDSEFLNSSRRTRR
jgi:hypothetical protein